MSPFEQKFVDVKFVGGVSGSVTVTLDEGQVFVWISFYIFAIYPKLVIISKIIVLSF